MISIYIHSFPSADKPPEGIDALELLSVEERQRAERFRLGDVRDRFLAAHVLLRQTLAGYLGIAPGEICYRYGERGKPALDHPGAPSLHFNLSHSGEHVLVAVCRDYEVGVDIEHLRPMDDPLRLGRHCMTPEEMAWLASSADTELQRQRFLRLWTCKEAFVKALGEGFACPLSSVAMQQVAPRQYRPTLPEGQGFLIEEFDPGPGCLAAVAVRLDGRWSADRGRVRLVMRGQELPGPSAP